MEYGQQWVRAHKVRPVYLVSWLIAITTRNSYVAMTLCSNVCAISDFLMVNGVMR
jgi:hypothetical protein